MSNNTDVAPAGKLTQMLISQRERAVNEVQAVLDTAADEDGRELTDAENENVTSLRSQIESLDGRIANAQSVDRLVASQPSLSNVPRADMPHTTSLGVSVKVRSEPHTYEKGSPYQYEYLLDLAHHQGIASQQGMVRSQERTDRMQRHLTEVERDGIKYRDVDKASIPGIVNPYYDPSMLAEGLRNGASTASKFRTYPLPSEGDSIRIPRVSTAPSGRMETESGNQGNTDLATTEVTARVFTVRASVPISLQALERGRTPAQLIQDELVDAYYTELNDQCLFGDNNKSSSTEPRGLLLETSAPTNRFQAYTEGTASNRTVANLREELIEDLAGLATRRRRAADCIVMSPGTWGKFQAATDTNGRPLVSDTAQTGRNLTAIGSMPDDLKVGMTAGQIAGVDVVIDPAIPDTFTDAGAKTGGSQRRIIMFRRSDVLLWSDGPMTYQYEQTLAQQANVLLIVRGYAAFTAEWQPSGVAVMKGTGTQLA